MRFKLLIIVVMVLVLAACSASDKRTKEAKLGEPSTVEAMIESFADAGEIVLSKHTAANWQVPLSGLLNLDHPKAKAAGLVDRVEPIALYVYVLEHPRHGTFLVDSGISTRFIDAENNPDVAFVVKKAMGTDTLEVLKTTEELAEQAEDITGVFLTHIHLDHIMGLTDLDNQVPVFIGAGDASAKHFNHLATRGTTDRLLAHTKVLQEWQFADQPVIDVFEDGSLWAIATPGHTPGSVSYLANTTDGLQLMLGDTSHTRWGWDNKVEPGSYTMDGQANAEAIAMLTDLVEQHPSITVHPGHQE